MFRRTTLSVAISLALATMAEGAAAAQGPSSSADSYLLSLDSKVSYTSILTTGDVIGGYRMDGIPDGLGAFDNGDGTMTVLMNHEIPAASGDVRAHGAKGAYVSAFVIDKTTLKVNSGVDLMKNVFNWDTASQSSQTTTSNIAFTRFCSADLPAVSALFNAATGLGTQERIFMHGEEGGPTGFQMATVATGVNKGNSFVLGKFNAQLDGSGRTGVPAWENALANPFAQDKTVVIANSDTGSGLHSNALSVYVGTKTNTGTEVDRAGLTNGVMKFVNVVGNSTEILNATTRATGIANGTRFTLNLAATTTFSRPEDGAWNPLNVKEYYFVTTDRLDTTDTGAAQKGATRLWRLTFDDITNVDLGGKIDLLVDGGDTSKFPLVLGPDAKPNMFDNIAVNADGTITLLEDTGGANHNGKIWLFDPVTGLISKIAKSDPNLFGDLDAAGNFIKPNPAGFHTNDEETSGVIDITDLLGRNDGRFYSLVDVQDHASAASLGLPAGAVEGGQLLLISRSVPAPDSVAVLFPGLAALLALRRLRKLA